GDTVRFSWIDYTGGTQLTGWIGSPDDGYLTRTLPFGFRYYTIGGPNINQINVCTNGFLESSTLTTYTNTALPASTIQNLIAPFWDDLTLTSQGAVYEKTGTDQSYVAYTWVNVPRWNTSELQTFQVVLYQDGKIRFNYLDMNGTLNSNTIGIQGGNGANHYYQQYVYDGDPPEHIIEDSTTILFYSDRIGIEETPKDIPVATVVHTAKPNPMVKGNAQISFSLAKKGDISINIYDATGRLTRSLINASYDTGEYTVTWNGRDDQGLEVMSGIYFYTIESENYKSTRKLVLMR
ncbi:MAG: T9SS type A sorting domain-containing protein, partial [candidate division WOR-3 bacterium]|nr:T9SS type A sorting domain-containing protein [candidate division WOR-3 bacterium]